MKTEHSHSGLRWMVGALGSIALIAVVTFAARPGLPFGSAAVEPESVRLASREGRDPTADACAAHVTGAIRCQGQCVDTTESNLHCGACGFACTGDTVCLTGRCVSPTDPQAQERARSSHVQHYSGSSGSYAYTFIGPRLGGRIDGIVADDSDQNDLTIAAPGGGIWRTQNNGSSWSAPANYGLGDFTAWKLQRDRISSSRLFLVTPMTLYASTDLGASWSNIGGRSMPSLLMPHSGVRHVTDPAPFAQMVFNSSTRLLLWSPTCEGLLYSTNGTSFSQLWPFTGGSGEIRNCINAIGVDDSTKRVFISVMSSNNGSNPPLIYRSNCAWTSSGPCCTTPGSCWDDVTTGLGNALTTAELTYTGSSGRHATATVSSGSSRLHNGSGTTTSWSAASNSYPPTGTFGSWDARPVEHLGSDHLLLGTVFAYSSTDLGSNWALLHINNMFADVRSFYHSANLERMWATTDGTGLIGQGHNIVRWKVTAGNNIEDVDAGVPTPVVGENGLPIWQPYFTAIVPTSGGTRLFIGLQDNTCGCSEDGTTWGGNFGAGGDVYAFSHSPADSDVGFVLGTDELRRYRNISTATNCYSLNSAVTDPGSSGLWSRDLIVAHPTNSYRVYVAAGARVKYVDFPTDNSNPTTPPTLGGIISVSSIPCTITTLAMPSAGSLYAGTAHCGSYVSTDDGATWSSWGPSWSTPPAAILRIAFSSYSGGTSWIASTDGLYRKVGSGSWSVVHGGSGYTVNDIAIDPSCPQRVYVALGFASLQAYHRGGVNTTNDNGASWSSTTSGLAIHQAPVSDIELRPGSSQYLYASVYGQGLWRMDRGNNPTCP